MPDRRHIISWKDRRIKELNEYAAGLLTDLAEANAVGTDQRKEIIVLKAGVETSYEVITVSRTGTRNSRGFSERVDALHHATTLRIADTLERVTVNKVESRRQALLPNGDAIRPFGN